jgi:hypothetical protein
MKNRIAIFLALVLGAALSLAPRAAGQDPSTLSFTGYYSGVSCIGPEGCVGAGLYGGTINGVNVGPGNSVPGMLCDDYFDNISNGETWPASGVNAASLNSSNIASLTLFGGGVNGLTGVQVYTAVAYLANLILTSTGLTSGQQVAISEAIWYITSGGKSGSLGSVALGYYNCAMSSTTPLSQYTNLYIYMPTGKAPHPQEMWSLVAVAEGGTALSYLLLAGLCCFVAIRLRKREQPLERSTPA